MQSSNSKPLHQELHALPAKPARRPQKTFLITKEVLSIRVKSIIWWARVTQMKQVQLWLCQHSRPF